MTNECKRIEQHLKAMLFMERPDKCDNAYTDETSVKSMDQMVMGPIIGQPISRSPYSAFSEWEFSGKPKAQTTNSIAEVPEASCELIDRAALTNFAAQHMASPHSMGSTSTDSSVLVSPLSMKFGGEEPKFLPSDNRSSISDLNAHFSDIEPPTYNSTSTYEADLNCNSVILHDGGVLDVGNDKRGVDGPDQRDVSPATDLHDLKKKERERERYRKRKEEAKEKKKKRSRERKAKKQEQQREMKRNVKNEKDMSPEPESSVPIVPPRAKESPPNITVAIPFSKDGVCGVDVEYVVFLNRRKVLTYTCEACDYNTSTTAKLHQHLQSPTHDRSLKKKVGNRNLRYLPEPLPEQVISINKVIIDVAGRGLTKNMIKEREAIAMRINCMVSKNLPGCSIEIVGSSVNGFGLQNSEADLVLKVPPELNAADMLAATFDMLSKDPHCSSVYSEFSEKIPRITFQPKKVNIKCNVTIDNGYSSQMTKLLSIYSSLDPRVSILGVVMKFWAHICELDQPDKGTLPSFCYPLMVIYFLQQTNPPVLPVIENISEFQKPDGKTIEDINWKTENKEKVGSLWLKMFKYYCFEYQYGMDVVSVCSKKKVTCTDKNWGTKFLAIEDPFVRRNLAHVIPNRYVFDYMQNCYLNTYRYFAFPRCGQETVGVIAKDLSPSSDSGPSALMNVTPTIPKTADNSESTESAETDSLSMKDLLEDHDSDLPFESVLSAMSKMNLEDDGPSETHDESETLSTASAEDSPQQDQEESPQKHQDSIEPDDEHFVYEWDLEEAEKLLYSMQYQFPSKAFKMQKSLPLVCRLCQKTGHLKNNCPDERLPPVLELPSMTDEYLNCITEACRMVKERNQPSCLELKRREQDRMDLQKIIKEVYPDAVLKLFGSFCNGFGFCNSDMDFCLTFGDNKEGKDLNQAEVIKTLALTLSKHARFSNVLPITSAKVPIVKFFDTKSGLESDISLYNMLAQHNTRMLETYCNIDLRVQIIGYVLKYFAKILDICDASRGSLSSYAYILMAIFFLQQRKPPVIPVLQELHSGEKPELLVDGWNAWFFDDIKRLPEVWPQYGKNKESVGELWRGLLSFYAYEFNMKEYVICIRQKDLLSRFRKLWNSPQIAIEDPFDLTHNLGSGLSRKMNNYIMKAFILGREHFGTPVPMSKLINHRDGPMTYLFDRRSLNKGNEPPNDRGCRVCGKIGHFMANCPRLRKALNQQTEDTNKPKPSREKERNTPRKSADQAATPASGCTPKTPVKKQQWPPQQPNSVGKQNKSREPPPGFSSSIPPPHLMPAVSSTSQRRIPPLVHPQLGAANGQPPHLSLANPQRLFGVRPSTTLPFPISNNNIRHSPEVVAANLAAAAAAAAAMGAQQHNKQSGGSIIGAHPNPFASAQLREFKQQYQSHFSQQPLLPTPPPGIPPPLRSPQFHFNELHNARAGGHIAAGPLLRPPPGVPYPTGRPQNISAIKGPLNARMAQNRPHNVPPQTQNSAMHHHGHGSQYHSAFS